MQNHHFRVSLKIDDENGWGESSLDAILQLDWHFGADHSIWLLYKLSHSIDRCLKNDTEYNLNRITTFECIWKPYAESTCHASYFSLPTFCWALWCVITWYCDPLWGSQVASRIEGLSAMWTVRVWNIHDLIMCCYKHIESLVKDTLFHVGKIN